MQQRVLIARSVLATGCTSALMRVSLLVVLMLSWWLSVDSKAITI